MLMSPGRDRAGDPDYLDAHGDVAWHARHYDLAITYRADGNQLDGRAVIQAEALQDVDELYLDLKGLSADKVSGKGISVRRFKARAGRVAITLAEPLSEGDRFTLDVRYSGKPGPARSTWGAVGWEELTDGSLVAGQPCGAPTWYPCNDRTTDKATYRLEVATHSDYAVVANGVLVSSRRRASTTTWVYEMSSPMAPYLATLHVGRYAKVHEQRGKVPQVIYAPEALRARCRKAFAQQGDMIAFFRERFGPYPFDEYVVVVTDDDLEIPLEAQALSTFGRNHLSDDWADQRLIAHELSHQWFGNSVTCRRLEDIWLHEGFACYAEWLWSEHSAQGTCDERARHYWGRLQEADEDLLVGRPGAQHMFDDRVYKRGALTLHAVRRQLGDEDFFRVIRRWTKQNRHAWGDTAALVALVGAETGQDISGVLQSWLYEEPLPPLPQLV